MSIDPIKPSGDPAPGFPADEIQSLVAALADTEFRVQHAEPIVRDLNRHLADLIGQCPNTASGCWVTLNPDNTVTLHADLTDVLRIGTALQRVGSIVSLAEVRRSLPSRKSLHLFLVEKVEQVRLQEWVESVHLNVRRPFGFFGKGR